ncbi:hypothetical protein [Amycolatopsis sp. NBC_01480]|uniref:hypothetical protein n=1 Tax=Amycolatopsis sp. NBC_01480 TaxID=2903562 RepID=UPI002E2E824C|nr:hypothetical protein [Amycolatopsis sp. NBC_01480]
MTNTKLDASAPIEVWLTQKNIEVNCMVVFDGEETTQLDVDSLSMRGAQREITGYLVQSGYEPVGRWSIEADGETSRTFKPAKEKR